MGTADDKLEILELIARYGHAVDERDAAAYVDVFTDDGGVQVHVGEKVVMAWSGRKELQERAEERVREWGPEAGFQVHHNFCNTVFDELASDRAKTRSYLIMTKVDARPGSRPTIDNTAVYHDEIVRTPKGWRFKLRSINVDGTAPVPSWITHKQLDGTDK